MTDVLAEFREAGALMEGHFILSSGLRSPVFLQKMRVFEDPPRAERLCRALAERIVEAFGRVDLVVSPAIGGIVPGYETARALGCKAIFVERDGDAFALRRGFEIPAGARLVVVEDIVSTGKSLVECLDVVRTYPGTILGAACLIDRSGGRADIGVPLVTLATVDFPAYPPDRLPPELAALPAVKPGSRVLAEWPTRSASASTSTMSPPFATRAAAIIRTRSAPPSTRRRRARTASPPTCAKTAATSATTTSPAEASSAPAQPGNGGDPRRCSKIALRPPPARRLHRAGKKREERDHGGRLRRPGSTTARAMVARLLTPASASACSSSPTAQSTRDPPGAPVVEIPHRPLRPSRRSARRRACAARRRRRFAVKNGNRNPCRPRPDLRQCRAVAAIPQLMELNIATSWSARRSSQAWPKHRPMRALMDEARGAEPLRSREGRDPLW
jgi:orotate phosphoribosyltransferase